MSLPRRRSAKKKSMINPSAQRVPRPNQKLKQTESLALGDLVVMPPKVKKSIWYNLQLAGVGWEDAVSHQYKPGDVVTVFQISPSKELVIEGEATIRKRVADVEEQYRVEFANKP